MWESQIKKKKKKSVRFVPSNVSAWALKISPSQKSRYLGTCLY